MGMIHLVVVRGLAAHWIGPYGCEWVATPTLDRLAATGTVFDHHFTTDGESPAQFFTEPDAFTIHEYSLHPPWPIHREVFDAYCEDGDDAHEPWPDPPRGPFDRDDAVAWDRLHFSFAAIVTQFDARLAKQISTWNLDRDTVIITSDAGLPLGEHGVIGNDAPQPFSEWAHIPLILVQPGRAHAGRRIIDLTAPEDLPAILRGESVARDHVISRCGHHLAIRTRSHTLLRSADQARLYRRPDDRFEVNDVARMHGDICEQLLAIAID
jgi:arylsulfatase A-like enzyme